MNHLIELELVKSGAKNITAVKSLLDMAKITEDNENFISQINALKENEAYLFENKLITGTTPKSTPNIKEDIAPDLDGAISQYYQK